MRRLAALALALAAPGCGGWHPQVLPAPVSPVPGQGSGALRAGFGRADITPPPGVGLGGNGPEGLVATGYRHRLYVRALVLEDPGGERMALVVADQAHISSNLHRLAAHRLAGATGIGADRLVVSATHSHFGSAHYYGERQLNGSASRLEGYDPAMVDLIVDGIVRAVRQAFDSLRPARAAWGFHRIRGVTKNRVYRGAYCLNPPALRFPCGSEPGGESPDSLLRAVDNEWKILRVDREVAPGVFRPAGVYSVLAIHGTANPSTSTLLDGDIHGVVERRVEALIDEMNGSAPGYAPRSVHVFANGAEGDVSPNRPPETQCRLPRLRPRPFAGPRAPPAPWMWADDDPVSLARCLAAARAWIDSAGRRMGDELFERFRQLEGSLTADFPIRRAFATLPLKGQGGLCPRPVVGTSTAAGASDVPTRVAGWKLLGLIPFGFEQGGSAIKDPPEGCQGHKQVLLGPLQSALIVGEHGLPDVAQLTMVRMGDVFLATVPAEPTTITARVIGDAVTAAVGGTAPPRVVVVSLANGFMQYVTTRHEYAGQTYEGGSTLYGPGTAEFLAARFAELTRQITSSPGGSPPPNVGPITAHPGPSVRILPRADATPALDRGRALLSAGCLADGRLRVTWLDEPPGRLLPAEGQVLALEQSAGTGWQAVAWDDQSDVVVESVRARRANRDHGRGWEWSVVLARRGPGGSTLRLRLLPRHGQPEFLSAPFPGCRAG